MGAPRVAARPWANPLLIPLLNPLLNELLLIKLSSPLLPLLNPLLPLLDPILELLLEVGREMGGWRTPDPTELVPLELRDLTYPKVFLTLV